MLHKKAVRMQNNILLNMVSNARKSKDTEFFIFGSYVSIATSSTKKEKKEESNKNVIQLAQVVAMPFGAKFWKIQTQEPK